MNITIEIIYLKQDNRSYLVLMVFATCLKDFFLPMLSSSSSVEIFFQTEVSTKSLRGRQYFRAYHGNLTSPMVAKISPLYFVFFGWITSFFIGVLVVYLFFVECVVRRRVSKEVAEAIGAETKWQTIGNPSDWTRVGRKEFLKKFWQQMLCEIGLWDKF